MPWKKVPCPLCSQPKSRLAKVCRDCLEPYERTPEHRQRLSDVLAGQPKPHLLGRKRPEHSRTMTEWWTPERRAEASAYRSKPTSIYFGLSHRKARALVQSVGRCQRCDHDGSESRLTVHHRDRDKRNQAPENLEVLCFRCHMQEHGRAGEIGRKKRSLSLR